MKTSLQLSNNHSLHFQKNKKNEQDPGIKALKLQLQLLQSTQALKDIIKNRSNQVQHNVFWYYTNDQSQYLQNIWNTQKNKNNTNISINITTKIKDRIKQITDDAFKEIQFDIGIGKLAKPGQQNYVQRIGNLTIQDLAKSYHTNLKTEYFSSNHPKTKQAQEKLKIINQDQQKFRQKINSRKKKNQQKKLQYQQELIQTKKKIQQQKKQEYHQQVQKKIQVLKLHSIQRKQQNQKFKLFLKQYKSSKPLHVLMQEQYLTKVQLPQLQEKRKQLTQRTKKHIKPTLQQLNKHDQQYINRKLTRPQKTFITNHTIDVGYKSRFYEKQVKKMSGYDSQQEQLNMYDYMEKKKRYSQFVKEKFKPRMRLHASVDHSNNQNGQNSQVTQENLQQSNNSNIKVIKKKKFRDVALQSPDRSRYIQVGKNYLQYVKNLDKKRNLHTSQSPSNKSKNPIEQRPQYINYLQDLKYQHRNMHKGMGSNWQHDLNDKNVNILERRDRVLMKSKQLQERAMREQQFLNCDTHAKASQVIRKKSKADDILIQSIRAKVAVLKDATNPI